MFSRIKLALFAVGEWLYLTLTAHMSRSGLMASAIQLPDGSLLSFGTTLGTTKSMTAISNATEAVATLEASHGVVVNDVVIVSSGWLKLNKRVVRASAVATNDVTLDDINTASTSVYPAGSGTGSVREITAWTQIPYIKDFAGSGGEQQTITEEFLDSDDQYEFFTSRSPRRFNCGVAYQGASATHFPLLRAASEARTETAFRIVYPDSSVTYFLAVPSFDVVPSVTKGQVQVNNLVLLVRAEPTTY